MKNEILKLRKEGKTYNQIVDSLGCSKGTISYHCGKGQKEKYKIRQRKNRKTLSGIISKKMQNFNQIRVRNFKGGRDSKKIDGNFNYETAYKKIINSPVCYLTGRTIDLENRGSYELDHIIPIAQGGKNTLKNMGITSKEANQAKRDMMLEDFIQLCKEVCENFGFSITKK